MVVVQVEAIYFSRERFFVDSPKKQWLATILRKSAETIIKFKLEVAWTDLQEKKNLNLLYFIQQQKKKNNHNNHQQITSMPRRKSKKKRKTTKAKKNERKKKITKSLKERLSKPANRLPLPTKKKHRLVII